MLKLKKSEKGKGKNFYRNEMLTPEEIVYFSLTLSEQGFNNFFFTMYVLSQTLTNAARPIPSKWTNAIRMHLALIPKAHTTVLAILRLLEMVWIVKVSLVLKAMKFLFCFPFECNSKLLRCTSEYMPTVPAGLSVICLFSSKEFEEKTGGTKILGFFSNKLSLDIGFSSCFSSFISSFQRATTR